MHETVRSIPPAFEVQEGHAPVELPSISDTRAEPYAPARSAVAKRKTSEMDVAMLLASKSRLRDAIILREILGPPRGLRVEEIGT